MKAERAEGVKVEFNPCNGTGLLSVIGEGGSFLSLPVKEFWIIQGAEDRVEFLSIDFDGVEGSGQLVSDFFMLHDTLSDLLGKPMFDYSINARELLDSVPTSEIMQRYIGLADSTLRLQAIWEGVVDDEVFSLVVGLNSQTGLLRYDASRGDTPVFSTNPELQPYRSDRQ